MHLLSTTDDGVPADIPPDRLYSMSWNPMNIVGNVAAVPGVAGAARIGVDGMTPMMDDAAARGARRVRDASTPRRCCATCAG